MTSTPLSSPRPLPPAPPAAPNRRWWTRVLPAAALVVAAYYVGALIMKPQRRIIESAAGALLIYLAFRLSMYQSLAFFLVVYPYPTFTTGGSTSTMILLVITVVWAVRVAARELTVTFRSLLTPVIPVIMLGYLLSIYSLHGSAELRGSMIILSDVLASLCLYFMVVNFVRDETTLRRTLYFLGVSSLLIHVMPLYQVLFPGHAFLPGWLLSEKSGLFASKIGGRATGPFKDFEILSEYCAVTLPLIGFLWWRAPRSGRLLWTATLGLTVFSLFATVTRGGFISLVVGMVYLAWLLRGEIGTTRAVGGVLVAMSLLLGMGYALPHVFRMESLYTRLENTRLEKGMPDSRAAPWTQAFKRAQEHVLLGHGPALTLGSGLVKYGFPHNGYLFLWVTIGLLGLFGYVAAFLVCFHSTGRYRGPYLSGAFVPGLLTALHVSWLVFLVDQAKIDFPRNPIYFQFVWLLMGLTAAATHVAREQARGGPGLAGTAPPVEPRPALLPAAAGAGGPAPRPRIRRIME